MRTCFALFLFLGFGLLMGEEAAARSTVLARFSAAAAAGADIEQTAVLLVHYFPGDGEAILQTQLEYDSHLFRLSGLRSALGQVGDIGPGELSIDYRQSPVSKEAVDTLWVDLQTTQNEGQGRWTVRIYSSLDPGGDAAHQTSVELGLRPPLELAVKVSPQRLFPGEELDLEMIVANRDGAGRSANRIDWEWPAGLKVIKKPANWPWKQPLEAGQADTLVWRLYVDSDKPGPLLLGGTASGAAIAGSPVPVAVLEIAPVPQVGMQLASEFLKVGADAQLTFTWTNSGTQPIEVAELLIDIPQEFGGVVPMPGLLEATVVEAKGRSGKSVLIDGIGRLEGGQGRQVELQTRPLRPGPFTWKISFRPVGYDEFIDLPGPTKIQVVLDRPERDAAQQSLEQSTDLQLMSQALIAAMERDLDGLQLQPGARVYLQPNSKSDDNWVVEDGLMQVLRQRGYTIVLKEPKDDPDLARVIYRLLEARVVYTAVQKGWNPFHADYRREALADLLVRAEEEGEIRFISRVRAYMADQVKADDREVLGGSDIVESQAIELQHKMIERGLSASILGGLFYIFFIP
ncbi:MAG: hypothetical protein GKR89_17260 [Candidatus Latescibacteria bacterium]|nr:hypothetical protein [Candidatus Latescibacterota bacterium]